MPNIEYGSDALITVQSDSMSESITHTRINSQYLGLNSDMAILDADIEFKRVISPTVNSMLSLHNNDAIGWEENDANWRFYTTVDEWNDGGIDSVGAASNTILMAGQASQRFSFSIEDVIQSSLDESSQSGLEFTLLSRLGDESFSTNNAISFGSTESATLSSQPKLEITYMLSQNSIVPSPELLTPVDGGPVWNLTGDNISANTLPSMTWNSSLSSPYGMLFQLSEDKYFRNLLFNNDSRVANPIQSSSGNFAIPHDMPLDTGKMYFWRMSNFDSDNRLSDWVYSSFLVSSLSSNWLGGDRYEMSLELGTESQEQFYPNCYESSISSTFTSFNNYGSSTIIVSDDQTQGIATSLLQCDVSNYLLPSGYAIESSQIELQLSSYSNPAEIGVWEGIEHNWSAKDVTWNNYGGAQGQLLDTQAITNSALQGDIVAWNVTSATQRSMRDGTPLDLIFNTITPSTSTSFYSSFEFDQSKRPSLKYVYIPGSNQLPDYPTLDLPLNGDWIYTPDFTLIGETKPTLDWTDNSQSSNVIGWALEIDSSSSFSSNELQTFTSWNDAGFDMTGTSFEIQNDLEIGEQWFWRVKALSDTYQLGDWSPASHFYLPNMDTTTIDADHFTMNLRHEEVMPHLSLPFFEDTYISDDGSAIAFSQGSSFDVKVGTSNIGDNFSGLVKMDINHQIQPNNGRLISANLKMYSSPVLSTQNIPVAVRPVLVPWADNASSLS
ncbi:MAG: DNRLRE domain-containing protein, partial [Euryarchaeota archaeon]|nr:DNRLRE domain-containing protein [Euryarchaeota archaeon]